MGLLVAIAGKTYTYRDLKFFAENGFIIVIDERDGDCRTINLTEWLLRAQNRSDEAKRLGASPIKSHYEMRNELQNLVADMVTCAQEAKEQGDHTDMLDSAWFRRHRPWERSRRRGSNISDFMLGAPPAGALPQGQFTGRTTERGIPNKEFRNSYGKPQRNLILPGQRTGPAKKFILDD